MPILFFSIAKEEPPTYTLSRFTSLVILTARFGLQAAEENLTFLRINGWINMLFDVVDIVTMFIVSTLGPLKTPIWSHIETYKVFCAQDVSIIWTFFDQYTLGNREKNWEFTALCPLELALLPGVSIPDRVTESKQPQFLVRIAKESLESNRYTLTDSIDVATELAWSLEHDDIVMHGRMGGLRYGPDYLDVRGRFINQESFAD